MPKNHSSKSAAGSASGKREDLKTIAVIGAGPIVIGQGCEFDYSGTQACKVLREEGYRVVLINSNPATIMTDPTVADRTYIEPLTLDSVTRILEAEKPDALLPTLGGQTALNLATELAEKGVLTRLGIELLGAQAETIFLAENREAFKNAMIEIGIPVPKSFVVHSVEEARALKEKLEFPVIIRAAFTLGGTGGSIAYNVEEFEESVQWGLTHSPVSEVLVEESVLGWKEMELEVMCDRKGQTVIVCGIENLDPMGVHTGDSITVAPIQTLTDKEVQILRDYAKAIMKRVGVRTGGSNVQFAVNPRNGRVVVIEMNPRVSRSSALASKATGFPIAKIAALLAVGYTLDEITNDITGKTVASFEPALDYVVVKIPRFGFEKFRQASDELGPQMRSVGEVMAIGRSFPEAFQKALRGLETRTPGLSEVLRKRPVDVVHDAAEKRDVIARIRQELARATPNRVFWIAEAFRYGMGVDVCHEITGVDPWFLREIRAIVLAEDDVRQAGPKVLDDVVTLRKLKTLGFSDERLGFLLNVAEQVVRDKRWKLDVRPAFLVVDTCSGEFPAETPYYYSTYQQQHSDGTPPPAGTRTVAIIGSGPNRIGQGLEFDYCCVHASLALREAGVRSLMLNCNPETVSTDYDCSDALYFEPLTFEDVMEVLKKENVEEVIVYFGGQTPLLLASRLEANGFKLLGSSTDQIDLCEDRERFQTLVTRLGLNQPKSALARTQEEATSRAADVGYPLLARPSYVIGGRGMCVIHREKDLVRMMEGLEGVEISKAHPLLLDSFLKDAIEVDVDALRDRQGQVWIPGVMEHIEEAGVHSGDSTCTFPPYTLSSEQQREIIDIVRKLVSSLEVVGLVNVQLAIQNRTVFIIEVNPRASRTIPFLSKAIGLPLAQIATKLMLGQTFKDLGINAAVPAKIYVDKGEGFAIKMPVFPFLKFANVDPLLGPEMKSTGEIMAIGRTFGEAFAKALTNTFRDVPENAGVFVSVKDDDKPLMVEAVKKLVAMGLHVYATAGTADFLEAKGIGAIKRLKRVQEGRPHVLDAMKNDEIHLMLNTTLGRKTAADATSIRRAALMRKIPYFTTVSGAYAVIEALLNREKKSLYCLQGENRV